MSKLLSLLNNDKSSQPLAVIIENVKEYLRLQYILVVEYKDNTLKNSTSTELGNCLIAEVLEGKVVYWKDISVQDNMQKIITDYLRNYYEQIINKLSISNDVIENFHYGHNKITLYISKVDRLHNKLLLFIKLDEPALTHDEIELLFNQIKNILMLGSFANTIK